MFQYRSSSFGPSVNAIQNHLGAVEKELEKIGRIAGRRGSAAATAAGAQIGDTISIVLSDMIERFRERGEAAERSGSAARQPRAQARRRLRQRCAQAWRRLRQRRPGARQRASRRSPAVHRRRRVRHRHSDRGCGSGQRQSARLNSQSIPNQTDRRKDRDPRQGRCRGPKLSDFEPRRLEDPEEPPRLDLTTPSIDLRTRSHCVSGHSERHRAAVAGDRRRLGAVTNPGSAVLVNQCHKTIDNGPRLGYMAPIISPCRDAVRVMPGGRGEGGARGRSLISLAPGRSGHHVCRHYDRRARCVAGSGRIVGGVTPAPWTVCPRNLARIAPRDHTPLGKSRGGTPAGERAR